MCQCCFEVCLAFLVGLSQLMIYSSGLIFINMAHPDIPINLFLPHRTLREKQLRARSGMPGSRWESILQLVKERKKKGGGGGIYTINALLTLKASRRWRKHTFRVIFSPHVRSYVFSPDTHTHTQAHLSSCCLLLQWRFLLIKQSHSNRQSRRFTLSQLRFVFKLQQTCKTTIKIRRNSLSHSHTNDPDCSETS